MTTKLSDRNILDDGTVICTSDAMTELLYSGKDLHGIFCNNFDDENEWKNAAKLCDSSQHGPTFSDQQKLLNIPWESAWFTPEPWNSLNIINWCLDKCKSDVEKQRVNKEFIEFEKRNMIPVIRHLIYCVHTWRSNDVFWGVGRGSSVSSFVLYLVGINRINPLEYNLDVSEWLK